MHHASVVIQLSCDYNICSKCLPHSQLHFSLSVFPHNIHVPVQLGIGLIQLNISPPVSYFSNQVSLHNTVL